MLNTGLWYVWIYDGAGKKNHSLSELNAKRMDFITPLDRGKNNKMYPHPGAAFILTVG